MKSSIRTEVANRKSVWARFLDDPQAPRHLFLVSCPPQDDQRPLLWPQYKQERIDWMVRKYERQVEKVEWLQDDMLPYIDMQSGTEIFAECFGCAVHRPTDNMPSARPVVHSAAEADALKVPDLWKSPLVHQFELADAALAKAGRDALLRLPDIQSPLDIAALIWEKSELFVALIEEPEAVKRLAEKVSVLLCAFLDAWFDRYGREFIAHYPVYYMPRGITLSEDEVGSFDSSVFGDFALPHLAALSQRYGGIGIHCCANARHQWAGFESVPGLKLLNIVHNKEMTIGARAFFADKCAQMHWWNGEGAPETWPKSFPPKARMVIEVSAGSKDDAIRLADKMRQACTRQP